MKISLHHTSKVLHKTAAAFIRGETPLIWLKEISRWNIAIEHLSCYVLPQSIQSPLPAGLFVVIKDASATPASILLDPYGLVAGKLFIPVHSSIYPECTLAELEKILIWEVQVFHPSIGLVGFEKKDAISLEYLLDHTVPSDINWDHADAGLPSRPTLQQIQVIQPKPEEIIEAIKRELETKPLNEIPGANEGKATAIEKVLDIAKYGFFKGLYGLTKAIGKVQEGLSSGNGGNSSLSPGMFEQLQNWLAKNIDVLEKKRQDEIERLLKMFDDNTDEALQYAIPLDSPYLDRGKAKSSSTLMRRSVSFSLGNLGGGGRVDHWDLGDQYYDLRAKYTASAQKQIEKGDFKKAAYIYAHLLGDFHSAANVLVQGKYYREAAALYKDHLKNTKAAAECLENGGLVTEAIDLYKELDNVEKVGDLYKKVEQDEYADIYFEKSVERYLLTSNYLEASRVLHEKKREDDRAKQVLMEGWSKTQQGENCLKRYFDIVAETEHDKLRKHVETVYRDASDHKQSQFLNVLLHVKQHYADEALEDRSVDIAYEIVSKKVSVNDLGLLPQLKHFMPGDKLLSPDVSRYIHCRAKPLKKQDEQLVIQLDSSIRWIEATWYHNQVIVIGTKENKLHLARCNWYNNVEYYSWPNSFTKGESFTIIANPYYSNRIIIKGSLKFHVHQLVLPKNKYFNREIIIDDLGWLPTSYAGFIFNSEIGITILDASGNSPVLHQYSIVGKLKLSKPCKPLKRDAIHFYNPVTPHPLLFSNTNYYTATDRFVVSFDSDGRYSFINLNSGIRTYAVSNLSTELKFVVSTNAGCMLLKEDNRELKIQGEIFATDEIPSLLEFISANRFVLAEKNEINVYEIVDNGVTFVRTVHVLSKVISIIPSSTREKFGVVEESGKVSLHEI